MSRLLGLLMRPRSMGLMILAMLLLIRIWDPTPVKTLRLQVFDYYQKIQPRATQTSEVLVIDVDEASLAQYGQWPWPRTIIAKLIAALFKANVRAVGLDIIFAEPDRTSPGRLAKNLAGLNKQTREHLQEFPDNDATLATILTQTQVVVSQSALAHDNQDNQAPPRAPPLAEIGEDPRPHLLSYSGLLRNIQGLEEAAAGHGIITLNPEPDGVVRRVPALLRVSDYVLPTLSLELLRVGTPPSTLSVDTDSAGIRHVTISHIQVPTDNHGRMWIHFAKRNPQRYISAKDLLNGAVSPERLANKLVLIGSSAFGLGDNKMTPIEGALPGVEIHAQILDMVAEKSFLTRSNFALALEFILILLLGLLIIFLVPFFGAVQTLFLGGFVVAGMIAASWYAYVGHGVLIDVSYGAVGIFGLYGLLSYLNYVREELSRRQIRNTFSRYISPTLVDQLSSRSEQLQLGGETKTMTILFCDIRNFTSISEQYQDDPQGLTQLINRLMTPLTKSILDHHGTIDKYIGDCIMAFWNAPLDDPDHAENACKAALDMFQRLDGFNEMRKTVAAATGDPFFPIHIGIGMNTGTCVVGNLGSEQRFDYSVLGDAVNVASRLEGQTKFYGVGIVIGPQTAALAGERVAMLEIDLITLRGKQEPARTYALLGGPQLRDDPHFQSLVASHSSMLEAFRRRRWPQVKALLVDCRNNPHAPPGLYTRYDDRLAYYESHPPPTEWISIFDATNT